MTQKFSNLKGYNLMIVMLDKTLPKSRRGVFIWFGVWWRMKTNLARDIINYNAIETSAIRKRICTNL